MRLILISALHCVVSFFIGFKCFLINLILRKLFLWDIPQQGVSKPFHLSTALRQKICWQAGEGVPTIWKDRSCGLCHPPCGLVGGWALTRALFPSSLVPHQFCPPSPPVSFSGLPAPSCSVISLSASSDLLPLSSAISFPHHHVVLLTLSLWLWSSFPTLYQPLSDSSGGMRFTTLMAFSLDELDLAQAIVWTPLFYSLVPLEDKPASRLYDISLWPPQHRLKCSFPYKLNGQGNNKPYYQKPKEPVLLLWEMWKELPKNTLQNIKQSISCSQELWQKASLNSLGDVCETAHACL